MRRPALTDESFLSHVFSPKKNAQPTGLRKSILKGSKGQRKARVNAYNRMTSVKQEVLKRSGLRDEYLKGTVTFTDAKQRLRTQAVSKGVVRPLRNRRNDMVVKVTSKTDLLARIADNIWRNTHGRPHTRRSAIDRNVRTHLDAPTDDMTRWGYDKISDAAKGQEVDGERYDVWIDGKRYNAFFYH